MSFLSGRIAVDMSKASQTVVKLKRGGEQFEVICRPETVIPYRNGKKTLDQTLLVEEIFSNTSKLDKVKASALKKAFETDDKMACIRVILAEGECPLTRNEMAEETSKKQREILKYLGAYYYDPRQQPPIPHPAVRFEQALETMRYTVKYNVDVETQIKEIMRKLPEILPVKPMDPPHLVRQEIVMGARKEARGRR